MEEENNPHFEMLLAALGDAVREHLRTHPQILDAYKSFDAYNNKESE